MPVSRFRSAADMPALERGTDADLPRRIRALWGRAFLLCPATPHRGIKRFRSITEANEDRLRRTAERLKRRAGGG